MLKAIRALVIIPCLAFAPALPALHAAGLKSETIAIPFAFRAQNLTLPAGDYQIQQADGSSVASLVNVKTGRSIAFIRFANTHEAGKARLIFQEDAEGTHLLKRIQ